MKIVQGFEPGTIFLTIKKQPPKELFFRTCVGKITNGSNGCFRLGNHDFRLGYHHH